MSCISSCSAWSLRRSVGPIDRAASRAQVASNSPMATGLTLAEIIATLNDELRAVGVVRGILIGHSIAGALMPMLIIEDPTLFSFAIFMATCAPLDGQPVAATMGNGTLGSALDVAGCPIALAPRPTGEPIGAVYSLV